MRVMSSLVLLVACTGAGTDDTDAGGDTSVPASCLQARVDLPDTVDGYQVVEGGIDLESTCDTAVRLEEVTAEDFTAEFNVGQPDSLEVPAGGAIRIPVTFTTSGANTRSETVRIRPQGLDFIRVPLSVTTLGPALELVAELEPVVRACPASLDLAVQNTGEGTARFQDLQLTLDGASLDPGVDPSGEIAPDARLSAQVDLLLHGPATLSIDLDEALTGPASWDLELATDSTVERTESFPAWEAGRPLDVLLTVDREQPDLDVPALEEGLRALLSALSSAEADYRVTGLLRDSGCPLGTAPVTPDLGVDAGAERLSAQLDLARNREGDGAFVDAPFALTQLALDPANTGKDGCNAWIRPHASLLVVHVIPHDDASAGTVSDHVASLRARLAFDDRLAVSSIAPPPADGCDDLPPATRLGQVASLTDGRLFALCGVDWTSAFTQLATVPGRENVLRLERPPHAPSLEVRVEGRLREDVTLDGTVVTLPRDVDRYRDSVEVRYVVAEACGGG